MLRRICLEDRTDRLTRGHPRAKPRGHVVERQTPLPERRQPPQVVEKRVRLDGAPVPVGQLGHEVRLVGYRDPAVPVQHHPQQRRSRAPDAEDEKRGLAHRGGPTRTTARSACPCASTKSVNVPGAAGGAQHEEPGLGGPRAPGEPPREASRVGEHADAEALRRLGVDGGPGELDVADPHRSRRRGRRDVPGPVDRDDGDPVRARPIRVAVPAAEPVERSLERHEPAQHPLLAVHEQTGAGPLGHRVVHADPVATAVAVGREHGRVHASKRDHGLGGVDPDRVREHDRPPVGLEADARPVQPVRDDLPGVVTPVPVQGQAPDGRVLVHDERPDAVVRRVEQVDRDRLGLAETERDLGPVGRAVADGREDLVDEGARDRAGLELEPLGHGERRRRPDEEGEDEDRRHVPGHGPAIVCALW